MRLKFPVIFVLLGLVSLLIGALSGVLISLVYIYPEFMKDVLSFNQLRPMHTTFVISWIILIATGGVYFYITKVEKIQLFSKSLGKMHLLIFILTGIAIFFSFLFGKMGGREYFEYYPMLTVPILLGWILFGINYFKTLLTNVKNWPVYYWMWGVGIVFMIYHLSEAHFWIFSDVRNDFIKDMTIQWKSYGSFVGSFNMLVYGTAIYVMSKIKDNVNLAHGRKTFFFFFLGLTNLMFGWAHHTYALPTVPWIRYVAYIISMTEWIIFFNIIFTWSKKLKLEDKYKNLSAYRFLIASEIWVFINLFLALLMSIPVINYYTHGTHITVAHSMGTTIGIDTTILFASICLIISKLKSDVDTLRSVVFKYGFYVFNFSLFLFFVTLIVLGINKAIWSAELELSFSEMHIALAPYYICFVLSGILLFISILMLVFPMAKKLLPFCLKKAPVIDKS